jgi:hypothetical protein
VEFPRLGARRRKSKDVLREGTRALDRQVEAEPAQTLVAHPESGEAVTHHRDLHAGIAARPPCRGVVPALVFTRRQRHPGQHVRAQCGESRDQVLDLVRAKIAHDLDCRGLPVLG